MQTKNHGNKYLILEYFEQIILTVLSLKLVQHTHITEIMGCLKIIRAVTCDFQQCGILASVDSNKPVQSPFKLINSKCCSVSSLTVIEYSSD